MLNSTIISFGPEQRAKISPFRLIVLLLTIPFALNLAACDESSDDKKTVDPFKDYTVVEDFADGTLVPEIDLTNYGNEQTWNIANGVLNVGRQDTMNVTTNYYVQSGFDIASGFTTWQMDMTIDAFSTPAAEPGQLFADIIGSYTDTLGDTRYYDIGFRGHNNVLDIIFNAGICVPGVYTGCDTWNVDPSLPVDTTHVAGATLGQTYTLKMHFDGTAIIFQVDDGTLVAYDLTFGAAAFGPLWFRHGGEAQFPTPLLTDEVFSMEARYDNFMMR